MLRRYPGNICASRRSTRHDALIEEWSHLTTTIIDSPVLGVAALVESPSGSKIGE